MPADIDILHEALLDRAAGFGIRVRLAELRHDVPGEFDGPTITLNEAYDSFERAFYLAHSIGSIAEWSLHFDRSSRVLRELREAKVAAASDVARLERALAAYLAFENRTWEFAAWLVTDTRHRPCLPAFSNFGRADMEAMRQFHATGEAPVWREFFASWNEEIRSGRRTVLLFEPRPIPAFRVILIPRQEIVQEDERDS